VVWRILERFCLCCVNLVATDFHMIWSDVYVLTFLVVRCFPGAFTFSWYCFCLSFVTVWYTMLLFRICRESGSIINSTNNSVLDIHIGCENIFQEQLLLYFHFFCWFNYFLFLLLKIYSYFCLTNIKIILFIWLVKFCEFYIWLIKFRGFFFYWNWENFYTKSNIAKNHLYGSLCNSVLDFRCVFLIDFF
jgi:hypothetical protein